jgi:hypothetical protein
VLEVLVSTPIKPPSGPLSPSVAGVDSASDVAGSEPTAVAAPERSGRVEGAPASEVQGSTGTVLARFQAGEVTREQAVEALVREALEAHGAGRLPASRRVELEGVLRSALLEDPTLSRLLG